VLAKVTCTYKGLEVEFDLEDDKEQIVQTVQNTVDYLLKAGFEAPKPVVLGGGKGGGQKSEFKFDAEKNRLYLFPNYMLTKDDKGVAFKEEIKRIIGAAPAFIHKDSDKVFGGKYHYMVPLKFGPVLYADAYFEKWEKPALPEGLADE
jgi:hypothetical protein